jgi:thioredoxin-dependent peroxiredoxin
MVRRSASRISGEKLSSSIFIQRTIRLAALLKLADCGTDMSPSSKLVLLSSASASTRRRASKFIAKHNLPFPLISDEAQRIVQDFGVWVEKNKEGRTYMGTERSTFVIGPDGRIKSIFRSVKPEEHAETVIQNLRNF